MRRREFIGLLGGVAGRLRRWRSGPRCPSSVCCEPRMQQSTWLRSAGDLASLATPMVVVAENKREQLPELAADLVQKRVAAIVTNTNATPFVISATKRIPIVFVTGNDPVAAGFVQNLNHPGGNVTGVSFLGAALGSKRLELLHELVPKAETVAFLVDPNYLRAETEMGELDMGARALGQNVVL